MIFDNDHIIFVDVAVHVCAHILQCVYSLLPHKHIWGNITINICPMADTGPCILSVKFLKAEDLSLKLLFLYGLHCEALLLLK